MRSLNELIDTKEPAIDLVRKLLLEGSLPYTILPASSRSGESLYKVQVTTRSPMGAIVYETGGILIDGGWLRILGSGCKKMNRSLPDWNRDVMQDDLSAYLVADDVLGGFFAINGGAFGDELGSLYYLPYDGLDWEPLGLNYSQFIAWSVSENLYKFYGDDQFSDWEQRKDLISPDQCYSFYPFLWTKEGSIQTSSSKPVPALEAIQLKL